ncbi:MAG: fumarylacetoacetate hydrolase family protein [Pseudomonadota bacterium]
MRFLVGQYGSAPPAVFLVKHDQAYNISARLSAIGLDLQALAADKELRAQVAALKDFGDAVPSDAITPALPIARPNKIMCLGLNYVEHIKEGGYEVPDYPAIFMRNRNSIMPAGAPMVRPTCSYKLDYEAELMMIIGQGGRHITQEVALEHVFGYTIFNDGSVRDYQRKTHQWTPGKNFDSTGAIGPYVVTPDEVPKGASGLQISSRIGDEILQQSNTSNMIWGAAETIAIISEFTTLEAGDYIALGTPPGVGHAKKPNARWLLPGETITIEIEGIGACANPVCDEAEFSKHG